MITQENILYTADEIKRMVKTCEKYNNVLERAREELRVCGSQDCDAARQIFRFFPELKSEDERIKKEIVDFITSSNKYGTNERCEAWLNWLEKQEEPKDKGEISDGYHTFNELYWYRMLYNAAFFNMLPKEIVHKSKRHHDGEECFGGGWFIVMANLPTGQISNHYELKDWDLFQIPEKEIADEWDGHTPQEAAERLHKYLLEKQGEQLTDKVEPKFKVGDWVILNGVVAKILDKQKYGFVGLDIDGKDFFCNYGHTDSMRLWTIQDAKDGDVLVDSYSKDSIIILYKGIDKERSVLAHCGWNGYNLSINTNGFGYGELDNTNYLPATKEQRDLLFEEMSQAGYEWDADKKELSKQTLKIMPKFCVGQVITDNNGTWYKITNIKCLDDWYYVVYDVCEDTTHHELCSIIDEKFRENRFAGEIKKMMRD